MSHFLMQDAVKPKVVSQKPIKKLSEEEQRRRKSTSEDSTEPRKILDKNRTHSFILELELGTEEALRQRGGGKNERHARKDKGRNENERSVSDERGRSKQKPEGKKVGDAPADEKEGGVVKSSGDEKKGSKFKGEKKGSGSAKEGRLSVTEGSAPEEGTTKDLKKEKTHSEAVKEKTKGEKSLGKTEPKQQLRLDSTGSTEERSEGEAVPDFNKKKDKQAKDILKRSKSHPEVKSLEKVKVRQDGKDVGAGSKSSTTDKVKNSEAASKVKTVSEKTRSKSRDDMKSQNPLATKADKKATGLEMKAKAGVAPSKPDSSKEKKKEGFMKEDRRFSEDRVEKGKDLKIAKKTSEKKAKESEKKAGDSENERKILEGDDLSSSSSAPSGVAEEVQAEAVIASEPSNTQAKQDLESLATSDLTAQPVSESDLKTMQVLEPLTESHVSTPQSLDSAAESDSTDQSISESLKKSDLASDSQAMDTESDLAALQSTDAESNLTASQTMDTESEPTAPQTIDTESDLRSPQADATKSDPASQHVVSVPMESSEELPTESDLAAATPSQSSASNLTVSESSHLNERSDLVSLDSSESNFTNPETSDQMKSHTDPTHPQSSDSIPEVPESSNSIPESDLTVAQPSNPVPATEFAVHQGSDRLPSPVPPDANNTPVSDDMFDALSDITPDPEDDEEATIPAEADALLSLMDVCASAAVRNSVGASHGQEAESSFQDADIKMKEAALTLLSMDPDQAVSPSFITEEAHVAGQQVESSPPTQVDVISAVEPSEVANESEGESSACVLDEGDKHTEGNAFLFSCPCLVVL